jgi:hypothetical protein
MRICGGMPNQASRSQSMPKSLARECPRQPRTAFPNPTSAGRTPLSTRKYCLPTRPTASPGTAAAFGSMPLTTRPDSPIRPAGEYRSDTSPYRRQDHWCHRWRASRDNHPNPTAAACKVHSCGFQTCGRLNMQSPHLLPKCTCECDLCGYLCP